MASQFVNTSWVSMEVLRLLVNKLVIAEQFNKGYQQDFDKAFAVGATIQAKFPQRFFVIDGMGYDPQNINRITTTVTLDQWLQVPFQWDDYEDAVNLERSESELRKQYYNPASAALAQEIDNRAARFAYQNANNVVGILGTDPTTVNTYNSARQRLEQLAAPPGERKMAISSSMMASLANNLTTIFNPRDEISKLFKSGYLGELAGFEFFESQTLYSHTAGTWAGAVTVTGGSQSGSSLIITGTNNDTIKKGDKISIANVNQVNPMTYRTAGPLTAKQFTVLNDYTLDGSADTILISPTIYGPGSQYQNVDALPADGAALTLWPGTSSPNGKVGTVGLALTTEAYAIVGAKLYLPKAVEMKAQQTDPDSGLSIRMVKAWDPTKSLEVNRLDMLLGFGSLFSDNGAVCVAGA